MHGENPKFVNHVHSSYSLGPILSHMNLRPHSNTPSLEAPSECYSTTISSVGILSFKIFARLGTSSSQFPDACWYYTLHPNYPSYSPWFDCQRV